jgi:Core-2/I-Branching enzyme
MCTEALAWLALLLEASFTTVTLQTGAHFAILYLVHVIMDCAGWLFAQVSHKLSCGAKAHSSSLQSACCHAWRYGCKVASVWRCRRQGAFASTTLVEAHRALLRAALSNPTNAMFVLLSESCIPLYHPALLWTQLMAENRQSRIGWGHFGALRFAPKMQTPHFNLRHWRKSSQWSALNRVHAHVVAYDDHVWQQFRAYCRTQVRAKAIALVFFF